MDPAVITVLSEIRDLLTQLVNRQEKPASSEFLTVEQAANFSGLAVSAVRRLIRLGQLPANNIGAGPQRPTWRIRWKDLEDYLSGRRSVTPSRHFDRPERRAKKSADARQ